LGFSPGVGLGIARRNPFLCFVALRAGENDSGFRIKSGMTRRWGFRRASALASPGEIRFCVLRRFAPERTILDSGSSPDDEVLGFSSGVGFGIARRSLLLSFAALRAGEKDSGFRVEPAMTRFWGVAGRWIWHWPAEFVFVFCGALRRRERFWIPDQVRNDEALGVRWASALASVGGIHFFVLRRFAPEML
jgi:hypothetical protein